jgi:hypothetical protein
MSSNWRRSYVDWNLPWSERPDIRHDMPASNMLITSLSGVMSVGPCLLTLLNYGYKRWRVGTEALQATQYSKCLDIDIARAIRFGPYSSEARQPRRRGSRRLSHAGEARHDQCAVSACQRSQIHHSTPTFPSRRGSDCLRVTFLSSTSLDIPTILFAPARILSVPGQCLLHGERSTLDILPRPRSAAGVTPLSLRSSASLLSPAVLETRIV